MLEEEVRRLAAALGGEEEEEEGGGRRRWRRVVWALVAVHKWSQLARQTTVLLQVEVGGGGASVGVCGGWAPGAHRGQSPQEGSGSAEPQEPALLLFQLDLLLGRNLPPGSSPDACPPPSWLLWPTCRGRWHALVGTHNLSHTHTHTHLFCCSVSTCRLLPSRSDHSLSLRFVPPPWKPS